VHTAVAQAVVVIGALPGTAHSAHHRAHCRNHVPSPFVTNHTIPTTPITPACPLASAELYQAVQVRGHTGKIRCKRVSCLIAQRHCSCGQALLLNSAVRQRRQRLQFCLQLRSRISRGGGGAWCSESCQMAITASCLTRMRVCCRCGHLAARAPSAGAAALLQWTPCAAGSPPGGRPAQRVLPARHPPAAQHIGEGSRHKR
jgi:hypothetical protein